MQSTGLVLSGNWTYVVLALVSVTVFHALLTPRMGFKLQKEKADEGIPNATESG